MKLAQWKSLVSPATRKLVYTNFFAQRKEKDKLAWLLRLIMRSNYPADVIQNAFAWKETPEGWKFWEKIQSEIKYWA